MFPVVTLLFLLYIYSEKNRVKYLVDPVPFLTGIMLLYSHGTFCNWNMKDTVIISLYLYSSECHVVIIFKYCMYHTLMFIIGMEAILPSIIARYLWNKCPILFLKNSNKFLW
ncbi:hypothetical protein ACJX0J_040571, partial [Zea mays]